MKKGERKTRCIRGHEFVGDNISFDSKGRRQCRACYLIRWKALDKETKDRYIYNTTIGHTGRTKEEYEETYPQDGKCAICEKFDNRRLSSDHDHTCCPKMRSCGKCVRGFLCNNCNKALGYLSDSPELLRKAAEYVEFWRTRGSRGVESFSPEIEKRQELSA